MILILTQIIILINITLISYCLGKQNYNYKKEAGYIVPPTYNWGVAILPGAIICFLLFLALNTVIVIFSYNNYINIKSYKNTIYTTAETLHQYDEDTSPSAPITISDIKVVTDFKYIDYQKTRATLLTALKQNINSYNTIIIEKLIYKKNLLYNWLIIAPDAEDKIITMEEILNKVK